MPFRRRHLGWQESLRNPAKLVEPENQSMMWASNASFPYNDERRSVQAPVLLGKPIYIERNSPPTAGLWLQGRPHGFVSPQRNQRVIERELQVAWEHSTAARFFD